MSEQPEFPVPVASDAEVAAFIARYGKPYDPETDDYHREPFVADIREGKNDPIYNAHSYHTKVPPRAIIPYILHYTDPGDIILDPFCGTGMTGVAAMMCADPPEDIQATLPTIRKGRRRVILNDLAPAACHIAYNYNNPVDPLLLQKEFDRIVQAVNEEFAWLYATEHYEPAVGIYAPENAEVARRLKNPPAHHHGHDLGLLAQEERTWELLDRAEVERRLGAETLSFHPLPEGIGQFIRIPAVIQHTVWSDVYKCEGMVTTEESTGRTDKTTGQPRLRKVRRPRGCGGTIVLWDAAVNQATGQVRETFACPACGQQWKKVQLKRIASVPVLTTYKYTGLKIKKRRRETTTVEKTIVAARRTSALEKSLVQSIEAAPIPCWFPDNEIDTKGPQYNRNALAARKIRRLADFYTKRNLRALAILWQTKLSLTPASRRALYFVLTSGFGCIEKMTRYRFKKGGNGALAGQLYFPSFPVEDNVLRQMQSKFKHVSRLFGILNLFAGQQDGSCITCGHAGYLRGIPDSCIDYVFTDPPFGSNIYYSEVNWLYECWLGRLTNSSPEAVVHRKNDRGTKKVADYARLMGEAFREIYRVLKPGRFATIEFNNSDGQVFEAIKEAARIAGFTIQNMLFLDKEQKTFKQIKAEKGEEDVVGHDVIFNLRKPAPEHVNTGASGDATYNGELEHLVADTIQEHLRRLPAQIKSDPRTYSEEHRTTPFLNTLLMKSILKDVNVERINLRFIEDVCSRYFKKIDGRWYLSEELVASRGQDGLFEQEVAVIDETTAVQWLRQRLNRSALRIGELRPHWMRATVHLTGDLSTRLERLLRENFWLDRQTNRWRPPTDAERAQMNNVERQRAAHDAERFLAGSLRPHPADMEILAWISHLYDYATLLEREAAGLADDDTEPELPDHAAQLYALMPRLLHKVLKENVEPSALTKTQRQCRIAARKLEEKAEKERETAPAEPTLFDGLRE